MAHVFWTDESLQYIAEIYKYIAKDSPQNADSFLNRMMDSVETQLLLSAEIGRITPEFQNPSKREIIYEKYRVMYTVSDDKQTAYITQVQHGAKPLI
ncbi:MAG: type II toxin-antitoxin system RelE/ParE family toxin [Oscillospiraceae bacterium]|jgi:plasmid stabilization system protein ParE|nr:type II toxin-antitoxin system RelE/ParE family toxin [Oscillospiraceae bacterium]